VSVVTLRTINCDQMVSPDCLYWDTNGRPENAATLRAGLAKDGWSVNRPGGEDICPPCVARIRRGAAPEATSVL
jgi:hypothetical protein